MRNVLEAIWWWTRVAVLALVGSYVLALLFENAGKATRLWYWFGHESDDTPIITIIVVSFLTGGVVSVTGWALLSAMIGYRRTREARRERLALEQRQAMQQKAARLRVKPAPVARPRVVEPKPRILTSEPAVAPPAATTTIVDETSVESAPLSITDEPIAIEADPTLKPTAERSDPERTREDPTAQRPA